MAKEGFNQLELERAKLIELGMTAKEFFNTPIGHYLGNMAAHSALAAMDKLKSVDPTDAEKIRALQSDIKRHEEFELWVEMAISAGDTAHAQYLEEFEHDQNNIED